MSVRLNTERIIKQVMKEIAMPRLKAFAEDAAALLERTAPTGPTGQLQRSFRVDDMARVRWGFSYRGAVAMGEKWGYAITSDAPYAARQLEEPLTHVPMSIIGQAGWQDLAVNRRGTRRQRYYRGLRYARAQGFPQYVWNYWAQAYSRLGGDRALKRSLEG